MKSILLLLTVLLSSLSFAQDSTKVKVELPIIVAKLNYGKTLKYDNVELKFVKIVSDSRCPKNVTCIWAGEAVVLVDVFNNGEKVEQKEIRFRPGGYVNKEILTLFTSKKLQISGLELLPYPTEIGQSEYKDYYLWLTIKN